MSSALEVLGYMELPEDDVPPEEYWHSPDLLKDWFDAVKARREERFSGGGFEHTEADDMTTNELAEQYREG